MLFVSFKLTQTDFNQEIRLFIKCNKQIYFVFLSFILLL